MLVFTRDDDLLFEFDAAAKGETDQGPMEEFAQIITDAINVWHEEKVIAPSRKVRTALHTSASPAPDALPAAN